MSASKLVARRATSLARSPSSVMAPRSTLPRPTSSPSGALPSQYLICSYLKYLTKKFLKKKNVRDFLHVIASSPSTYELRFFSIDQDEEDAE
jgi:hypothetical protein